MRIYGADCSLSKLPKMFLTKDEQAQIYKEIFPYDYYTKNNYLGVEGDIIEAFKCVKDATIAEFVNSIVKAGALISGTKFDMPKYAEYYC